MSNQIYGYEYQAALSAYILLTPAYKQEVDRRVAVKIQDDVTYNAFTVNVTTHYTAYQNGNTVSSVSADTDAILHRLINADIAEQHRQLFDLICRIVSSVGMTSTIKTRHAHSISEFDKFIDSIT